MRAVVSALFVSALAFGQSFEVASVKLSAPPTPAPESKSKGRLTTSPGRVDVQALPLLQIFRWAYDLQGFQVDGPHWTEDQPFDVAAKAAGGPSDAELRAMMRNLLTQRFHLVFHREKKELPVYEMTIPKGGHKLVVSHDPGDQSFQGGKGLQKLQAVNTTLAQFADLISRPLHRPVLDKSGLSGTFNFTLDPSGYLSQETAASESSGDMDREAFVLQIVQQQLGLKLEPARAPLEIFLIDRADKVPAEN